MTEAKAMISENTTMKLHMLKLHAMAGEFERQSGVQGTQALSFEERFSMIVDCEFTKRENGRLARLIRNAGFSDPSACVEGIEFGAKRNLDNAMIQRLASCEYIASGKNVHILGATGVGKTYLSSALGVSACRNSLSVRYTRLPDLLVELALAKEIGEYAEVVKSYKKPRLLIIDDWIMFPANDSEAHIMYDLIEARKHSGSIIVCSQFDSAGWHELIDNPIAADSICDRLAHNAYKIVINGESMRKRRATDDDAEA